MFHSAETLTSCYSLLSGVQELVLAATAVTHPDSHVSPETADCVNVAPLQLSDVHCVHVLQPFCIDLKKKKPTAGQEIPC